MPRTDSGRSFGPRDLDKARKRLFVQAMMTGAKISQACLKSGFSEREAAAFRKTDEFVRMSRYFWATYLRRQFKVGSQKLFSSLVTALSELAVLVRDESPEIRLRAISELRQWLADQKNPVLQRLSAQILEESEEADEETLSGPVAVEAKHLLNRIRRGRLNGRARGGNDAGYQH